MSGGRAEVVYAYNMVPFANEAADGMKPDESGCACNENFHCLLRFNISVVERTES